MMTFSEMLFAPMEGESEDAYKERVELHEQILRNALNNTAGRRFAELLTSLEPPYEPRFASTSDPIEAAIKDGRKEITAIIAKYAQPK